MSRCHGGGSHLEKPSATTCALENYTPGQNTDLAGGDFRGARLKGKDLREVDAVRFATERVKLFEGNAPAGESDERGIKAMLRFKRRMYLVRDFTDAEMVGADFTGARCVGADFSGVSTR